MRHRFSQFSPGPVPLNHLLSFTVFFFILLHAGCARFNSPPFPIGLYDAPEEDLSIVASAGFSHVQGREVGTTYLDYAQRLGLKVLPFGLDRGEDSIRSAVKAYDRHPATWGWYLFDEPDLHNVPPAQIDSLNAIFKTSGATKPTVLVLMDSSRTPEFAASSDILMLDHYPVPWAPLSRFAYEMETARSHKQGPFLGIIQAFDWIHFPGMIDQTNKFRAPTYDEIRCMTYMACAEQVDGLFYYTYAAKSWKIREHETWNHLTNIVQEIRDYLPLFTARHFHPGIEVEYSSPHQEWNEMNRPSLTVWQLRTRYSTPALNRGRYLLCINTLGEELAVTLKLPPKVAIAQVIKGGERGELRRANVRRTFAPYEVVIFKILR